MTTPLTHVAGTTIRAGLDAAPTDVDLVVVGLGVTGAGVALDAVTRGLTVLAVDAHDLAFGTSRWSSKLVHGGLRYLAKGQVGIAHESAVERGLLMDVIAPHLTHALPMLMPYDDRATFSQRAVSKAAIVAGDLLRRGARTPASTLPRPRVISPTEALQLVPRLNGARLRGATLGWDGQLEDDARLVTTIARTAAAHGAHVRTRARVLSATGTSVELRDELTGTTSTVHARAVVSATGVWSHELAEEVELRPSQGTHLVLRGPAVAGMRVAVLVPVPHSHTRFLSVLPQADGTVIAGLTDEELDGPVLDVPVPTEAEIDWILDIIAPAFALPLTREDIVGTYAGLRPLLRSAGSTADVSRKHAVLTSHTGLITIVGGKLTTYRRMAEDAVDAAVARAGMHAGPCRTRRLPLLGAATRRELADLTVTAPSTRLVRRFGTDAALVLDNARAVTGLHDPELLAPIAPGIPTNLAELVFGVTHEGAHDVADLLDRRTRIGLVPADRLLALPVAERALRSTRHHVSAGDDFQEDRESVPS